MNLEQHIKRYRSKPTTVGWILEVSVRVFIAAIGWFAILFVIEILSNAVGIDPHGVIYLIGLLAPFVYLLDKLKPETGIGNE